MSKQRRVIRPQRGDHDYGLNCPHDWRFDGDDPYIVCANCRERRDAVSGRVITAATCGPTVFRRQSW